MGSISDFLENELLDHVFGVGAYTPPSTVYLALSTADPTDDGSGLAEPATANGYVRVACAFDAAASRAVVQASREDFTEVVTATWGSCTHWALCDNSARATGNVLASGAFDIAKTGDVGFVLSVPDEEIYVDFSAGEISDYLANKLLDFAFRNQAYSAPTIYVTVCSVDVTDAMTGSTITELGNGMTRTGHSAWNTASGGATSNDGDIEIGPATAACSAVTAMAIVDAASAGNLLFYDNTVSETIAENDGIRFPDEDLTVTIT